MADGKLPNRLGTLKQAADLVPCHVDTLRRRIKTGELTAYRIGRQILRVDLSEVEQLFTREGDAA